MRNTIFYYTEEQYSERSAYMALFIHHRSAIPLARFK